MIEIGIVTWLCVKNAREARGSGHSAVGYVLLTIGLWFGMEFAGLLAGYALVAAVGGYAWWLAYVLGLLSAIAGGVISYRIAANLKIVDHNERAPLTSPAQVTVVRRESSALNVFAAWDVFLNGVDLGKVENNKPVTTQTNERKNVLTAKGPGGSESPPYEFSAGSGFHMEVWFNGGRFGNAHRIDA